MPTQEKARPLTHTIECKECWGTGFKECWGAGCGPRRPHEPDNFVACEFCHGTGTIEDDLLCAVCNQEAATELVEYIIVCHGADGDPMHSLGPSPLCEDCASVQRGAP